MGLLFGLVVFCLFAYLAWWVLSQFPLPQPIRLIVTVLFVLICAYILLDYFPVSLPHGRF